MVILMILKLSLSPAGLIAVLGCTGLTGAGLIMGRGGGAVTSTIFKMLLRGATGRGGKTIGALLTGALAWVGDAPEVAVPASVP